jgi:hypothetical protein
MKLLWDCARDGYRSKRGCYEKCQHFFDRGEEALWEGGLRSSGKERRNGNRAEGNLEIQER